SPSRRKAAQRSRQTRRLRGGHGAPKAVSSRRRVGLYAFLEVPADGVRDLGGELADRPLEIADGSVGVLAHRKTLDVRVVKDLGFRTRRFRQVSQKHQTDTNSIRLFA